MSISPNSTERAKAHSSILSAYLNGQLVEYQGKSCNLPWTPVDAFHFWDFLHFNYRIVAAPNDISPELLAKLPDGPECWERVKDKGYLPKGGDIFLRKDGDILKPNGYNKELVGYWERHGWTTYRRVLPPIPEGYELVPKDSNEFLKKGWRYYYCDSYSGGQWKETNRSKYPVSEYFCRFIRPITAKPVIMIDSEVKPRFSIWPSSDNVAAQSVSVTFSSPSTTPKMPDVPVFWVRCNKGIPLLPVAINANKIHLPLKRIGDDCYTIREVSIDDSDDYSWSPDRKKWFDFCGNEIKE